MTFTIIWTPAAEQELAAIWLAASDRTAVTSAADAIDRLLRRNAADVGTPRFDTVRSIALPPIGVDYEVLAADRLVYVLTVWESGTADSQSALSQP